MWLCLLCCGCWFECFELGRAAAGSEARDSLGSSSEVDCSRRERAVARVETPIRLGSVAVGDMQSEIQLASPAAH